ncbi:hypothetical protein J4449_03470 [Candidatus Woesearchaeota archaeon]|nr:hypothetical protein [Candidatus Woesearchaeota archaeon]
MFKKYGVIGIILIIIVEINFIYKVEPFASWYFPLVWFGYILVLDSIVYKLKKDSLLMNRPYQFFGLLIASSLFWWIFEFVNLRLGNWNYNGATGILALGNVLKKTIAFSTVLPAFFETVELIRCFYLFEKKKLHKKHKITRRFIHTMLFLGFISFLLPVFYPKYFYPLIWMAFFFILDPINYLHKQPSIIGHLKDRNLEVPFSLLLAGIIMGFFWEFWNYWAVTKWYYNIPFLGFFKIFEMPILGYLGYFPFAFELYAMYFFLRSLFLHKEHLMID